MDFASPQRCDVFVIELRDFVVFLVEQTVMEFERFG